MEVEKKLIFLKQEADFFNPWVQININKIKQKQ